VGRDVGSQSRSVRKRIFNLITQECVRSDSMFHFSYNHHAKAKISSFRVRTADVLVVAAKVFDDEKWIAYQNIASSPLRSRDDSTKKEATYPSPCRLIQRRSLRGKGYWKSEQVCEKTYLQLDHTRVCSFGLNVPFFVQSSRKRQRWYTASEWKQGCAQRESLGVNFTIDVHSLYEMRPVIDPYISAGHAHLPPASGPPPSTGPQCRLNSTTL